MLIEKATKLIKNKKPSAIKIGSRITSKKDVNVTRTSRIYVECQKKMSFKISQYGLQRIDGNENSGLVYIICDGETIFSIQNSMYGFPKDNISINIEKYHVAEVFICVRQNSKEPCWIEISNLLVE